MTHFFSARRPYVNWLLTVAIALPTCGAVALTSVPPSAQAASPVAMPSRVAVDLSAAPGVQSHAHVQTAAITPSLQPGDAPAPEVARAPSSTCGMESTPDCEAPEVLPLRRLRKKEVTRAVALEAREIIDANFREPFGTQIPFTANGEQYVARIEQHYHPPGGDKKPWGHHAGVSVFVRRPLPN